MILAILQRNVVKSVRREQVALSRAHTKGKSPRPQTLPLIIILRMIWGSYTVSIIIFISFNGTQDADVLQTLMLTEQSPQSKNSDPFV